MFQKRRAPEARLRTTDLIRSEDIYQALFDDEAFAALPQKVAELGGGRSAMLFWVDRQGSITVLSHSYFTADFLSDYAVMVDQDPWVNPVKDQTFIVNRVLVLEEFVSDARFQQSGIYNEVVRKHGDDTFRCIGGKFQTGLGSAQVGVHRGKQSASFEREDAARLGARLGDVFQVLRVRGELAAARAEAAHGQTMIDAMGSASITVNREGRILKSNAIAEQVLRRGDGLVQRQGVLSALNPRDAAGLSKAIAKAAAAQEPSVQTASIESVTGAVTFLTVAPLRAAEGPTRALIIFQDPVIEDNSLALRLQSLFGLTRIEASIAIDIANGLTNADIVIKRGVSYNTVKTQMKTIGAKMGHLRQVEIAATVASLPRLA